MSAATIGGSRWAPATDTHGLLTPGTVMRTQAL
jgi:hypothetical protein